MTEPERQLPRNVEAEAALIGAMLMDNRTIDDVADKLSFTDFFEPLHGRLFDAIVNIYGQGKTVTPVTLKPMFDADETLIALGGIGYLAKLTESSVALIGYRDFATQIAELSKRRSVIGALQAATALAFDTTETTGVDHVIAAIEGDLSELTDTVDAKHTATIAEVWDDAIQRSQDEANGIDAGGIELQGFLDWGEVVGKMQPQQVTIGAGRPGMGKTALALHIAASAALEGHGTGFILLESDKVSMVQRALSGVVYTGPDSPTANDVIDWKVSARERMALDNARHKIGKAPLIMSDPATLYAENLQSHIRRLNNQMMRKYGVPLKLLIIDYLQLMGSTNRYLSKTERVGLVSAAIKTAAKECNIHILALAQLSRAVEARDDKRPQMSDLRDSGEIEQDAANIVFFYRPAYYHELKRPEGKDDNAWNDWKQTQYAIEHDLHLIGAKRRFGSPTTRIARFMAAHQAVRSSTRYEGDEGEVLI